MRGIILLVALFLTIGTTAQHKIENVILVTTDGLRWQEIFKGVDPELAGAPYVDQEDSLLIVEQYWDKDVTKGRARLMPFFWSVVAKNGQLYGNRLVGNNVNTANPHWFSYPGYSEMITGYGDKAINSNDFPPNPHVTVLEFFHKQAAYRNKVSVFGNWSAFGRIANKDRSGIPVVTGYQHSGGANPTAKEIFLNELKDDSKSGGKDLFAFHGAIEHLNSRRPKLMQISFDDTDHYSHEGKYYNYLNAARQFDRYVEKLWNYIQSDPHYRNKTALVITTDHGRGDEIKTQWRSHGDDIKGADQVWLAILAPGIPAKGEVKQAMQLHLAQVAQTIAKFLGQTYTASHPIAPAVKEIWEK